ncbi:MAG: DUF4465 domain-containing protein [Bacteroidales bacterium]
MKKTISSVILLLLFITSTTAQSYLTPGRSYKTKDILVNYQGFATFEVHDSLLYANDGDTIRCFNLKTEQQIRRYGKPSGYTSWPSFLTISPNGKEIWAGFTNPGNTDDRIYSINIESGVWDLQAHLSGNFDLEFLNDNILVSGLNSSDWQDPASVFLLDTTGADNHRRIIETGGSSAGLAADAKGNVYYGTNFYSTSGPNALYRWDSAAVAEVIHNTGDTLKPGDAIKLTDLPNAAYDCEVDTAGNILFNINSPSSDKVLAVWNGTSGDGFNFDTLALTADGMDWLTMIKTCGNVLDHTNGNGVYILSVARPVAKVQRSAPPKLALPFDIISAFEEDAGIEINLNNHFTDTDDTVAFSYEIISNSHDIVASGSISNDSLLIINILKAGQTNIWVKATSNHLSVTEKITVGVQPEIYGNYVVTDFENLALAQESYWNGSDSSGGFASGLATFANSHSGGFWEGWAYSNTSDVATTGYFNQYSAITGAGFDTLASDGKNYGVAYVATDWITATTKPLPLSYSDSKSHLVKGLYVTNSAYAALSMEQGDAFAKKFGGEDGNDPDYLKLSVWGKKDGTETDTIDFYLADYRFNDNKKDYIVKTWQWIELSSLGMTDTLLFDLTSSDVGMFGINTPLYFNVDNIYIVPDSLTVTITPATVIENLPFANAVLYPNPSNGIFRVKTNFNETFAVRVYSLNGNLVYFKEDYSNNVEIDISNQPSGQYFIYIENGGEIYTQSLIKE